MHVECVTNKSGIALVLVPESPLEEEILKNLHKQSNNAIVELRGQVTILNRSVKNGVYIGQDLSPVVKEPNETGTETM